MGMQVWQATITPRSTSTDSFATTVNQTPLNAAVLTEVNDYIRTLPSPLAGVIEASDAASSARNSGLWKVTGAAQYATSDGLHPSTDMHVAIAGLVPTDWTA